MNNVIDFKNAGAVVKRVKQLAATDWQVKNVNFQVGIPTLQIFLVDTFSDFILHTESDIDSINRTRTESQFRSKKVSDIASQLGSYITDNVKTDHLLTDIQQVQCAYLTIAYVSFTETFSLIDQSSVGHTKLIVLRYFEPTTRESILRPFNVISDKIYAPDDIHQLAAYAIKNDQAGKLVDFSNIVLHSAFL